VSVFKSEKLIWISVPDLTPVGHELVKHFQERGFEVTGEQNEQGGWDISITKGGVFKAVLGLKTALKVEIKSQPGATLIRAGTGIFGRQVVPTAITMLVAWPVLLSQVWGLIRQANLDDEAIRVVEVSLNRLSRLGSWPAEVTPAPPGALPPHNPPLVEPAGPQMSGSVGSFCTNCGQLLSVDANFCAGCGQRRVVS
jgi:hypothetical protein